MAYVRPADTIVVTELSRMSRSLMHLLEVVKTFDQQGIELLSLRENIDTSGICLRRDSGVSVMYAEALNSTTSSVTLQRTDRHGILGQKSAHCQMSL